MFRAQTDECVAGDAGRGRRQHGCSALHAAAASGQLEVVHWLLENCSVDRSATDHVRGSSCSWLCVRNGEEGSVLTRETATAIRDGRVPRFTQDEQTALHYAAFFGHLEVVQYLVEHEVPLDIPDKVRNSGVGTCHGLQKHARH